MATAFRLATLATVLVLAIVYGSAGAQQQQLTYRVPDTGQIRCFGGRDPIAYPKPGRPWFGQDAQWVRPGPRYRDEGDGTVTDLVTGLVWQKTPDFKMRTFDEAAAHAKKLRLAGRHDWRVPSIKELFSIADFGGNMHSRTPYIDTRYFDFRYPDPSAGARDMDGQYWSSNRYLGRTMGGDRSAFGFNFADGRIKAYPVERGRSGRGKLNFVRCVRGRPYGRNDFTDHGDGTVTDCATGLMWTKADSAKAMDWKQALAFAEKLKTGGHTDWRLPDVKELQSIVDYRRAPDAQSRKARGPAIDPVFDLTKPESWCWSSTTHIENRGGYYVCFGRALSARKRRGRQINAHGAGAVRSDPKTGDPSRWPDGLGPQADEIRIANFVRCVRGGDAKLVTKTPKEALAPLPREQRRGGGPGGQSGGGRFVGRLDRDGDGKVSRREFDGPPRHFDRLDRNGDGYLTEDEAPKRPPGGRRGGQL